MKYLVMVQGSQADYETMRGNPQAGPVAWSEEDVRAMFDFMGALNDELTRSGELVDAQGLVEPAKARFVTAGADGRPVVTDDPYDKDEVVVAGYWVLDCASLERVTEIAARVTQCPEPAGTPARAVVIRPIGDGGGDV